MKVIMKVIMASSWIVVAFFLHAASCSRGENCVVTNSLSGSDLKHDQALFVVKFHNLIQERILYGISEDCYECELQQCAAGVPGASNLSVVVGTDHLFKYAIKVNGKLNCSGTYNFNEHGVYIMENCDIKVQNEGNFVYLPFLILLGSLIVLLLLYIVLMLIYRRCQASKIKRMSEKEASTTGNALELSDVKNTGDEFPSSEAFDASTEASGNFSSSQLSLRAIAPTNTIRVSPKVRIKSLDTFRGIAIVTMIFVNYGGGKYWFLDHSKWNGLTVADLVFPWFIFAMGSSIFISCRSLKRKGKSKKNIITKIIIRSAKLLALGLFLNNGGKSVLKIIFKMPYRERSDIQHWRLPGVLQRFAISYLVVATLNVCLGPKDDIDNIDQYHDWRDSFRDIAYYPWQHVIMILILLTHTAITFIIHDPACPRGYLGPGGLAEGGKHYNCTGGAAGYIDRLVFGVNHIYNHPTCGNPYKCIAHDPEGLLGILPSIFLTYLGLQASRILFIYHRSTSHTRRWLFWFLVWGALAVGLCKASIDGGIIPINKNLWSLSFVFATGALAYLLLTICYVLVDVKSWWTGAPFYYAGMNAILLYLGHEILADFFPFNFKNDGSHMWLTIRAAVGTFVWVVVAFHCYREKIFFKL